MIGADPAANVGGVATAAPARDQWPHNIRNWDYWDGEKWESDPLLTVTEPPEYLTVSSSGPAEEVQPGRMGVYRQSGETHNNKPVWSRHDGTQKLFYNYRGAWMIGTDPAADVGGVATVDPARDQWPHNIKDWEYYSGEKWQSDPLLTVTEGKPRT